MVRGLVVEQAVDVALGDPELLQRREFLAVDQRLGEKQTVDAASRRACDGIDHEPGAQIWRKLRVFAERIGQGRKVYVREVAFAQFLVAQQVRCLSVYV